MAKMNALFDAEVIDALYEASQAGVTIRLIVRGICALRPGVPGLSENIEVRSVVGRFLEHSRIFRFENGNHPELYLSSGDWMVRNLRERVEVMVPVNHPENRRRIEEVLSVYWADNVNSQQFRADGQALRKTPQEPEKQFCAQNWFLKRAEGLDISAPPNLFKPLGEASKLNPSEESNDTSQEEKILTPSAP
jgi:polyphosphate kinase